MKEARRRILFVDDEPHVLAGLRRLFRPLRREWDVHTAKTGAEALALLGSTSYDVVVSDMRMPVMDGAQLLEHVSNLQPETVRLILTGQSNDAALVEAASCTHQILSKPCDADVLVEAVERSFELRGLMNDPAVLARVGGLHTLPALPAVYRRISAALRAEEVSTEQIGELVAQDMGLAGKLLQVVNSAYFGRQTPLVDPVRATVLLGTDTVRGLVLGLHLFDQLASAAAGGLPMHDLFGHGFATGQLAKTMAQDTGGDAETADAAYLAGLLHDVGLLVLSANEQAAMRALVEAAPDDWLAAERAAFQTTHAEIGAYLLGLWGLPEVVVRAVACHHDADDEDPGEVAGFVRAADRLTSENSGDLVGHGQPPPDLEAIAPGRPDLHAAWRALRDALLAEGALDG